MMPMTGAGGAWGSAGGASPCGPGGGRTSIDGMFAGLYALVGLFFSVLVYLEYFREHKL